MELFSDNALNLIYEAIFDIIAEEIEVTKLSQSA